MRNIGVCKLLILIEGGIRKEISDSHIREGKPK